MKTLFTLILVSLCVSVNANTIELDYYPNTGAKVAQVTVYQPVAKQVRAFGYAYISEKWSEGYTGLAANPTDWFEGAIGFGKESTPNSWRTGGWIWTGKGKISALYCFEDGTSGSWHKTQVRYQLNAKTGIGYTEKTFKGEGFFINQKLSSDTNLEVTLFSDNPEIALKVSF